MIAAAVLAIGLLAIAQLLAVALTQHQSARMQEEAARLGFAKIEELEKLDFSADAAIQLTPASPSSLSTNVANYFDTPTPNYTRRWRVQAGPTTNTRKITLRIVPTSADNTRAKQVTLMTIVRSW